MNIKITTFTNPFSFFCTLEETKDVKIDKVGASASDPYPPIFKNQAQNVVHGQYVAVMWGDKWVRGIVSMESQFLVWLVDYGIYLRSNDMVCVNLPAEYKYIPTKVFEASIHGVVPIDKNINYDIFNNCIIENEICQAWSAGAIAHAQQLISSAAKTYFIPVALMSTKSNDVVLGDLYLEIPGRGITSIIEELELWPIFLLRNKESYIKNLGKFYTSRRRHRASQLKPNIPDLPTIYLETTLEDYSAICVKTPQFEQLSESDCEGSTVVGKKDKDKRSFTLTPEEIERYSNKYITICGREYNILNIVVNKLRDIKECDKYEHYDTRSVGRGYRRFK